MLSFCKMRTWLNSNLICECLLLSGNDGNTCKMNYWFAKFTFRNNLILIIMSVCPLSNSCACDITVQVIETAVFYEKIGLNRSYITACENNDNATDGPPFLLKNRRRCWRSLQKKQHISERTTVEVGCETNYRNENKLQVVYIGLYGIYVYIFRAVRF